MRIKKIAQTLLATIALLAGSLPVLMTASPASAAVTTIPNLPARWESISSPGTGVTCAIATNRTMWCWGIAEGVRGVAWDATKGDPAAGTAMDPKQVGSATNWKKVSVSFAHACASNTLQEIWCWGSNAQGQLGNSTFTNSQTPVLVRAFGKKWNDFDTRGEQSCAVADTTFWCWGDGLALPSLQTLTNPVVTSATEVQLGDVIGLRTGERIWLNGSELLAPSGQTWRSFQVARELDYGERWGQNYSACAITSNGSALCYNILDLTKITNLGGYTDWLAISSIETTPRTPICGLRGSPTPAITCFNTYLSGAQAIGQNYGLNSPYLTLFTNGAFPWVEGLNGINQQNCSYGCWSTHHRMFQFVGTIPKTESIDLNIPGTGSPKQLVGSWFQGSVPQDTSYFVWGRLFAISADGQMHVIGDGKHGERQDGIASGTVTDSWAASLVQTPTATSADRTLIPKTGGATVSVNGSFLVGVTGISVGSNIVSDWTESDSGTSLTFTSPSSLVGGTNNLTVTTNAGSTTIPNALTFGDSPSAPTITGLSPGDKSITVGWSAPSSVGSSPVSSYLVTVTPGGSTCTWTVGPLSCAINGLTNGTTYRATVRASSAVGPGLVSANSASFVPYTGPSAPPITSIAPEDGQITVTWSAAANNGSPITRYEVVTQPGGNSCSTTGTGTSCTISPLTNGTPYSISVYATNDAGGGEVSTSETSITPRTLAGTPTNVVINPGDRQLGVSWRAPSSNGGSAVTSYTVTAQPGSVTCTAIAPSTNCNLLGLSNGSVYSITVVATNPAGDSASSATVTGSPVTIPGKPTISATEPGSNSVLVRWRAPSATGGASVSSYSVVASPGGNSCSTSGAVLFCTVTGLDNGTTYSFTVTATNSAGTGSVSASYNGVPSTIASAPRSIAVSPTNGGITASWAAPSYDGGTAITGYIATVRSTGDTCTTNSSTRTCSFTGLVNGSTYIVDVVATNNAGSSESGSSSTVTPRTVPSKPIQVTLTPGAGTLRVTWAAPLSDGGSAITSYIVTATPGSGITCTSVGTYCDLINLTPGTNYSISVVAINAAGTGTASTSISAMPYDRPGAPTSVSATADDLQINVSWAAPSNTGGSEITGYIATATPGNLTCSAPSTATSCSIRGLTNGTKYTIKVTAINAAGFGPDSIVAGNVIPRGVSIAPTNISVEAQDKSLVVRWRAVTSLADTNGAAITKYIAKAMPSGLTCQVDGFVNNVASTTCTITGLTNGIAQTVNVVAVNDGGTSANSLGVLRTPRSAPSAPVGVIVEVLSGALSISWNPPVDSGGIPITSYSVTAAPSGVQGTVVSCSAQSGDSRNCLIDNLSNGTTYVVNVIAQNDVGTSRPSEDKTATPAAVPSKPVKVRPQVGNSQISIRWDAAQDNGSPITSYRVALEPGGYECEVTDLSFLGCTIGSLDNGIAYSISVYATNAAGDSELAQVDGTATPRAIASPVQSVFVSAATGQATVSWTPGFNGGSAIQSYTVSASPGGNLCQASGTATQCVVKNLVNGTQYTFSVIAVNEAGSSQPALSSKTLIAGTPNAPVALKVKPGDETLTISFAPPAINGGTAVTNYSVFVNDEVVCTVAPAKLLTCTVDGLENGAPQVVRVVANNLIGPSVSTPEVVSTPGRTPGRVSDVIASAGVGGLSISWTEPEDDGGSPITGYVATVTPGGKTCKVDADTTTCDITGLTIGTTYTVKVVAVNGIGASVATTSEAVKIVGAPTAVRNLSATALAKGAKIFFATPSNNGGSPITNYYFTITGPNGYSFDSGPVAVSQAKSSYIFKGLTKGLTYTISVMAENDYGMSAAATVTVKSK